MRKMRLMIGVFFLGLCFGTAAAAADLKIQKASPSAAGPAVQAPAAVQQPMEPIQIKQKASRKLGSQLSAAQIAQAAAGMNQAQRAKKLDLVCSIAVYYDEAHTMPVQNNTYHSGSQGPQRPVPFGIYYVLEVKNAGFVSSAANVTNQAYFTSNGLFPQTNFITSPPENLSPGEIIQYDYYTYPMGIGVNDKTIAIIGRADFPNRNAEDEEGNNQCSYNLKIQYP